MGKYDYDCLTDEDLRFKKGDLMYILHTDDQGWMWARLKETGKEGYIPSTYVCMADWGEGMSEDEESAATNSDDSMEVSAIGFPIKHNFAC